MIKFCVFYNKCLIGKKSLFADRHFSDQEKIIYSRFDSINIKKTWQCSKNNGVSTAQKFVEQSFNFFFINDNNRYLWLQLFVLFEKNSF